MQQQNKLCSQMSIKFKDYCLVLLVPDEFVHNWNLKIIAIFRRVMFSKQFFLLSIIYTNKNPIGECSICLIRSVFYLSLNGRLVADRFNPYECQVGVTLSSELGLSTFQVKDLLYIVLGLSTFEGQLFYF